MFHLWSVSALSKEIICSPVSISQVIFLTYYFVSPYCCRILVLWYTFSIHLFSCVIPSQCHMTTIFNFISHHVRIVYLFSTSPTCAWVSRLPTASCFLKETALSFAFWLLEPVQCLGKTFVYLIFCPVTQNIILILKTFRHFKLAEAKTLLWWRQSCVCPLIDHRQEPIKMRE